MTSQSGGPPRVAYWCKQPTPYFVGRFNAVADRGSLDFEAWFNTRVEENRSWDVDESSWRFRGKYVPARRILGVATRLPIVELSTVRPDLLVQEYDRPYLAAGFLAAKAACSRVGFRVLPNYDAWSQRTWWREASKYALMHAVDGAKVPGPDGRKLAERYGLSGHRSVEVTQSIDVGHFGRPWVVPPSDREERRRQLGLHGCVFLYAGRIWRGKGLEDLFEAFEALRAQRDDVSLLLVGDGVDEDRYRLRASGLGAVAFSGFVQPRDLPDWYALADVLVFPTLGDPNGLVVEEALAAGLPVVVSESAGDIRRRVPEGEVGYVVPTRDAATLTDRMQRLAADPELRTHMSHAGGRLAQRYHHERFAEDFDQFVQALLSRPRRRGPMSVLARAIGAILLSAGDAQVRASGFEHAA